MNSPDTTALKKNTNVLTSIAELLNGDNFSSFFGMLSEGAYCVDRFRRILHWNASAERITGYLADDVVGGYCYYNLLQHIDDEGRELCSKSELCPLYLTIRDGVSRREHASLLHRDGRRVPVFLKTMPITNSFGERVGALELFEEDGVVESLREQLEAISKTAYLDSLTGLPNRRYLDIRLAQCIEEWERYGWPFVCFVADIDKFKTINDTFGHTFGDQAISIVANTIALACRSSDTVGRWGGDEIVGVLKNVEDEALETLLNRMNDLVRHTRIGDGKHEIIATASIGATVVREGDTAKSILHRADEGLYKSKQAGRDRYTIV